jgi:hypothetical protein
MKPDLPQLEQVLRVNNAEEFIAAVDEILHSDAYYQDVPLWVFRNNTELLVTAIAYAAGRGVTTALKLSANYYEKQAAASPASLRATALLDAEDIRQWARANGYQVGGRGRIPQKVSAAYAAVQRVGGSPTMKPDVLQPEQVLRVSGAEGFITDVDGVFAADSEWKSAINFSMSMRGFYDNAEVLGVALAYASARGIAVNLALYAEEVRQWAQANGYEVGERDRIPAEALAAYEAAQQADASRPA